MFAPPALWYQQLFWNTLLGRLLLGQLLLHKDILIRFSSMIRSRQATIRLRVSPLPDTPCCFQMFRGSSAGLRASSRATARWSFLGALPPPDGFKRCWSAIRSASSAVSVRDLAGALSSSFLRGSFLFCSDGLFSLTGADPFSGFHRFSPFHFHFPAKKSVHMGEVGSDPRAGYFFNEVPCPPALRFTISWRTGEVNRETIKQWGLRSRLKT